MSVPELTLTHKHCLDRTTIILGETGTGKSSVIVDILHQLQPHADQIIVISPTDRQNHTYDRGIVPLPCIHYAIRAELLEDIWERQSALVAAYTKARRESVVESLFRRIPNNELARKVISQIDARLREYANGGGDGGSDAVSPAKLEEMRADCQRLRMTIWCEYIAKNESVLQKMSLTIDEKYTLRYINLNPRLVLIFDDCTEQINKYKKNPVIQKLFYQGRHSYISMILASHTDKSLDPELKKNAFITVFTGEATALAYFNRPSNDLDKESYARAVAACRAVYTPLAPHQKLVWLRAEKRFCRFTATLWPVFRFGNAVLWDYCDRIKSDGSTLAAGNKFIGDFV
jgi:hypothetical protein